MKTKIFATIASLFLIGLLSFALTKTITDKENTKFNPSWNYHKEWKTIDSLEQNGLPKSALEIVEKIYQDAKLKNNHNQFIKALIYRMKFKNSTEEDAFEKSFGEIETEINEAKFPSNSIMHSILGEMYWMYYQHNRWKFLDRSTTVNFDLKDVKTWDLNTITQKIISEFNLSIANADELQKANIQDFQDILIQGNIAKEIRPTLYDFLAIRAIETLQNQELSVSKPIEYFEMKEDLYFADNQQFVNSKIETKDTLSTKFQVAKLYQKLLKFHIEKQNISALIDADLLRLNFVLKNSDNELKDSLYFSSLQKLENKYSQNAYSTEVSYAIAKYLQEKSSTFNALEKQSYAVQWNNKKAYEICQKILKTDTLSYTAQKAKYLMNVISSKQLSFQAEQNILPSENFAIRVAYQNTPKMYVKVLKIQQNELNKLKESYYSSELYEKLIQSATQVYVKEFDLKNNEDFNNHSTEIILDKLAIGTYMLVVADNPKFEYSLKQLSYQIVTSTNLSYFYKKTHESEYDFFVCNRESGEPMQNVKLTIFYRNYNYTTRKHELKKGDTFLTNLQGNVKISAEKIKSENDFYVKLENGEDVFFSNYSYYLYKYQKNENPNFRTHLFTDRAIYRPGQTVFFKAICTKEINDKPEIHPNLKQSVAFYDVNYQLIKNIELTTNDFGTFSGSFEIPTGLLNGNFQIVTVNGSKDISVEEYKRPKFEVVILPLNGNYLLNQKIEIKGNAKAYSGSSLSDAKVTYRITREPIFTRWWYRNYDRTSTEIANGELQTDEKGNYIINFDAKPDLKYPKNKNISFNYKISVQVTDINGESQNTEKNIRIGYSALEISNNFEAKINKDKDLKYFVFTQNLNSELIKAQGEIKVYKLIDVEKPLRKKSWEQTDVQQYSKQDWDKYLPNSQYESEDEIENLAKGTLVFEDKFDTEKSSEYQIKNISQWATGAYLVEMKAKDAFGNLVENEKRFVLYSVNAKQIPVKSYAWFWLEDRKLEVGETAKMLIGSSKENVKVLYEIELRNKIIKSEWITLNNEQKTIALPITEDFRGNVNVHITMIKDNRFYKFENIITVPYTNKELDIKFETFRNNLYPGEKEEWRLVLKGKNGEKVASEMLATLYDASLDNFKANNWSFDVFKSYYSSISSQSDVFNVNHSTVLGNAYRNVPYPYLSYNALNWFGFYYYNYQNKNLQASRGGKIMRTMAKTSIPIGNASVDEETSYTLEEDDGTFIDVTIQSKKIDDSDKNEDVKVVLAQKESESQSASENPNPSQSDVKIRSNFNETAFFYPHLQTNENGEIIIKFTVPESLTKWKMMGFAHTKDLMSGIVENELVTQKELMVQPNAPRFFRENDQIVFPVKVSNVSENTQFCQVSVEFYDAISMRDITNLILKTSPNQNISVEANQNSVAKFALQIPEGIQAIGYKVVAKSPTFSDGEENVVPVMSNRILVTESLPLPIRGNSVKDFRFEKLINSAKSTTLRNHNFTLEFTSNPAWYAVQALPYLMEYPYDCSEQTFSKYYANSIATHIANSNPKIKAVFDSWKTDANSKALLSNLEKNQELKTALLQETPWVLDAQNETERKNRIGLLFDLIKMSKEKQSAEVKLKKMQNSNGGWSWFDGMPDNRYITQHIICGFGHLDKLKIVDVDNDKEIRKMIAKAVPYLDARMADDYDYLKKHLSEKDLKMDNISQIDIQYLYTRSFFSDIEMNQMNKEAYDYFFAQAQKYWMNKDKYSQALIALALFRKDDKKTTANIIKSLKENSQNSEELGMYWKDNVSGYYWYQAPIETQALMIEMFNECTSEQNTVEDLKVWLLKQKQTQDWKTTKATSEAVYALLLTGKDWLSSEELVKVSLGNILIDPTNDKSIKTEAGTGYFKKSWTATEITPEMGNIKVTKTTDGVAWGSVYWQYFEQLDKITSHETPLKLNKKLFLEKITDAGKTIEPITETTKLKVGDKITVRIELRVDRDMDYVHMKDMRASCFEPLNVFSGYRWQGGLGYYETTKDASTNFFFDRLNKGTYVFEYPLVISHEGDFSNGITTIQSMYAPEFTSHSEGVRVGVK